MEYKNEWRKEEIDFDSANKNWSIVTDGAPEFGGVAIDGNALDDMAITTTLGVTTRSWVVSH